MSMLFGWSDEENEWADNYERFIKRIKKILLSSIIRESKNEKCTLFAQSTSL